VLVLEGDSSEGEGGEATVEGKRLREGRHLIEAQRRPFNGIAGRLCKRAPQHHGGGVARQRGGGREGKAGVAKVNLRNTEQETLRDTDVEQCCPWTSQHRRKEANKG